MSETNFEYGARIAEGDTAKRKPFRALAERLAVGTTASGEDLWNGTATTIPIQADSTALYITIVSRHRGYSKRDVLKLIGCLIVLSILGRISGKIIYREFMSKDVQRSIRGENDRGQDTESIRAGVYHDTGTEDSQANAN